MVSIDDAYQLVLYIVNKEQSGTVKPSQFNLLAKMHQLNFVSKRLDNPQLLDNRGVPQFGYNSTWRIHEDLRPMLYGPIQVPINSQGNFNYPDGYLWLDSITKNDVSKITLLTEDQYATVKRSEIFPPTDEYPISIFRNPYGFIDPYTIGSFQMSYLKIPPDPRWAFDEVNDAPVYNAGNSVNFSIPDFGVMEVIRGILQDVGVNLDALAITQYADMKTKEGQ